MMNQKLTEMQERMAEMIIENAKWCSPAEIVGALEYVKFGIMTGQIAPPPKEAPKIMPVTKLPPMEPPKRRI